MIGVLAAVVLAGSPSLSSTDAPTLNFVAQLDIAGGARAVPGPFFFSPGLRAGFRFDPVRFGVVARGLLSSQSGVDVGGFASVDVLRLLLDSERNVSLFVGADVYARFVAAPTLVLLGVVGVRAVGISLSIVGGVELSPAIGNGEVRLGVEFVELISALSK
ncbi:MAG: hypothetical protein QM817_24825 [Archangium sp.]